MASRYGDPAPRSMHGQINRNSPNRGGYSAAKQAAADNELQRQRDAAAAARKEMLAKERRIRAETQRRRRMQKERAKRKEQATAARRQKLLEDRRKQKAEYVAYLKRELLQQQKHARTSRGQPRDIPVEVYSKPRDRSSEARQTRHQPQPAQQPARTQKWERGGTEPTGLRLPASSYNSSHGTHNSSSRVADALALALYDSLDVGSQMPGRAASASATAEEAAVRELGGFESDSDDSVEEVLETNEGRALEFKSVRTEAKGLAPTAGTGRLRRQVRAPGSAGVAAGGLNEQTTATRGFNGLASGLSTVIEADVEEESGGLEISPLATSRGSSIRSQHGNGNVAAQHEEDLWALTTEHAPSALFDSLDLSLSHNQSSFMQARKRAEQAAASKPLVLPAQNYGPPAPAPAPAPTYSGHGEGTVDASSVPRTPPKASRKPVLEVATPPQTLRSSHNSAHSSLDGRRSPIQTPTRPAHASPGRHSFEAAEDSSDDEGSDDNALAAEEAEHSPNEHETGSDDVAEEQEDQPHGETGKGAAWAGARETSKIPRPGGYAAQHMHKAADFQLPAGAAMKRGGYSRRFGSRKPRNGRRQRGEDAMSVCSGYSAPMSARSRGGIDSASVVSFNDGSAVVNHPVEWGRGDNRRELQAQHDLRNRRRAYEKKVRERLLAQHKKKVARQRAEEAKRQQQLAAAVSFVVKDAAPAQAAVPRPRAVKSPKPAPAKRRFGAKAKARTQLSLEEEALQQSLQRLNTKLTRVRSHSKDRSRSRDRSGKHGEGGGVAGKRQRRPRPAAPPVPTPVTGRHRSPTRHKRMPPMPPHQEPTSARTKGPSRSGPHDHNGPDPSSRAAFGASGSGSGTVSGYTLAHARQALRAQQKAAQRQLEASVLNDTADSTTQESEGSGDNSGTISSRRVRTGMGKSNASTLKKQTHDGHHTVYTAHNARQLLFG